MTGRVEWLLDVAAVAKRETGRDGTRSRTFDLGDRPRVLQRAIA